MKYGIVENHQFVLIDDDSERLENTLLFMPRYSKDQIKPYAEDEIEQGIDGCWYEKGFAPKQPLEKARAQRLAELADAFGMASKMAHCLSSAGFEINADETANRNVSSLIYAMEATGQPTVEFCAYDNSFHDVTLARLKTMKLEIISNAQAIYARKWALREQINAAETIEMLNAVEIVFDLEGNNGTTTGL